MLGCEHFDGVLHVEEVARMGVLKLIASGQAQSTGGVVEAASDDVCVFGPGRPGMS